MSEYAPPGQVPHYQEKRKRHSNRPVALIGVTVCIVMVIVFNAAKVTMGALENNHTSLSYEAISDVAVPALLQGALMDALNLIVLWKLWQRRLWAHGLAILIGILGMLYGIFIFMGAAEYYNSANLGARGAAEYLKLVFIVALANAPTVCYLVMTVLLFTPSLLRRTYANEMY